MEKFERLVKVIAFCRGFLKKITRIIFPEEENLQNIRYPEFLLLTKFFNVGYLFLLVPFRFSKDTITGKYKISTCLLQKVTAINQN